MPEAGKGRRGKNRGRYTQYLVEDSVLKEAETGVPLRGSLEPVPLDGVSEVSPGDTGKRDSRKRR